MRVNMGADLPWLRMRYENWPNTGRWNSVWTPWGARPGSSESLRLSAAMALGLIGDPEAVPLLLETLASTGSLGVRAACAKALGLIGDASAVAPLVALAGDDGRSEAARAFACVSLGLLGERTRLPFLEPLKADGHYLLPLDALNELLAIL